MGGSLEQEELNKLHTEFPQLKELSLFIETGTYKGVSTRLASKNFKDVYTFEINLDRFVESMNESLKQNLMNCHHYLGNSYDLLRVILQNDKRSSFFFLDAHQSGGDSSNNGKELVPLIEELNIINELYPQILGVVCVDDYRLWNTEPIPDDWKHITNERIFGCLSNHKINSAFMLNDRLYILIN